MKDYILEQCKVLNYPSVKDIYKFAKNVTHIIYKGGVIFVSVPFTWEYHGYPDDYWRFTPAAIEYLFRERLTLLG